MKKLQLKPEFKASANPCDEYNARRISMTEKQRLITDIREFVGKDGHVPFEHGFRPSLNASEVDSEGIRLRSPSAARSAAG